MWQFGTLYYMSSSLVYIEGILMIIIMIVMIIIIQLKERMFKKNSYFMFVKDVEFILVTGAFHLKFHVFYMTFFSMVSNTVHKYDVK